jgi:RNA polymerase sigma factor for flagellar operon FliA
MNESIDSGPAIGEEAELWRQFCSRRDPETRRTLIQHYLHLARRIAGSIYAQRYTEVVEFEDCLQYARVGLIEAIDRFDPSQNVQFATFATYRIRGSILNGLEHASERAAQHKQRRRVRLSERVASIRTDDSRSSGSDPFADMVDVTLALALGYILEDSGMWRSPHEDADTDPYRSLELGRLRERFALIVQALPEREQLIVRWHYFEHMEFGMIGEMLGLSKGRISQLHARALRLVRDAFQELGGYDAQF